MFIALGIVTISTYNDGFKVAPAETEGVETFLWISLISICLGVFLRQVSGLLPDKKPDLSMRHITGVPKEARWWNEENSQAIH